MCQHYTGVGYSEGRAEMSRQFLQIAHSFCGWCVLSSVVAAMAGCSGSEPGTLVITAQEFDQVAAAPEEPPLRGAVERGAPVIVVDSPDPEKPLVPPFDVWCGFSPVMVRRLLSTR